MTKLDALLKMPPFSGYLYAYPHKTAYRAFAPPLNFSDVWQQEKQDALFLYVHIPFCEMRCGFCNLFTMTGAKEARVSAFMSALRREAEMVKAHLPRAKFSQIAIGGGTPTFLSISEMSDLFDITGSLASKKQPLSIETSPSKATPECLELLESHGVTRISMGIESFAAEHLRAMGRPARAQDGAKSLDHVRKHTTSDLNIDLIYGAKGQSVDAFCEDVRRALSWDPEEIFIYPLYVGPLTGLSRTSITDLNWDQQRLAQYRAARDILLAAGYSQSSMRRFERRPDKSMSNSYSCQDDGMIGIGAGARSYTRSVHYSSDYAVSRGAIQGIIDGYNQCDDFSKIHHGIHLSRSEQIRRYVIKSVLNAEGLDMTKYLARFGRSVLSDLPELEIVLEANYLAVKDDLIIPTSLGFERADAMGPFLISADIKDDMQAYKWA